MASIRLNRLTKTIKVVNRKDNIRLKQLTNDVSLKHTGKTGPQGVQGIQGIQGPVGPTGVSTFVRAHHESDPTVARPNALYVEWVGSVAPNNATVEDTWVKTP